MSRLVLSSELLSRLRAGLLHDNKERCAILFGRSVEISGRLARIVVRHSIEPPTNAYTHRTTIRAQLRPEYVAEVTQKARLSGESLVFAHSHPFPLNCFSETDNAGEAELAKFLLQRIPSARHGSMLLTPEISIARELGQSLPLRVLGVGSEMSYGEAPATNDRHAIYDRHSRAFGRAGHKILASVKIGIVGLGGTGSVVLQQISNLGVRDFLLCDPDTIEESNLNRVVSANALDIGRPKVEVAAAFARRINPNIHVEALSESVLKSSVARSLADVDLIFCCTDSHGSRAVLNQFAYQYLVPVIDMGVVIAMEGEKISNIAGRTQLLAPGLACMVCSNLLDPEQIRRDLLTDFERQVDPI